MFLLHTFCWDTKELVIVWMSWPNKDVRTSIHPQKFLGGLPDLNKFGVRSVSNTQ